MKVSDLEGPMLDYWVARATTTKMGDVFKTVDGRVFRRFNAELLAEFYPSTDWSQGGPLIENNKIGIWPGTEARPLSQLWSANIPGENGIFDDAREQVGFTPLEAAMRALVASKFGEEVGDEPA